MTVPERMLSLAIGREGQNARLAARLTGWRIDIRSDVSVAEAKAAAEPRRPSRRDAETHRCREAGVEAASPRQPRGRSAADAAAEAAAAGDRRRRPHGRRPRPPSRSARAEPEGGRAGARCRGQAPPSADAPADGATAAEAREPSPKAAPRRQAEAARRRRPPRRPRRRWRRRPGRPDRRPAAQSRAGPASPAGRPGRSVSSCASSGRPTARSSSTPSGRLAGRGAYLCRTDDVPRPARSPKGALERALTTPLPAELRDAAGREPSTRSNTTSKEEPVARSRSGTRGRRGPRKPPRRDGAVQRSGRPDARPARAWRDRAARHDHRQGARRAARRQPGGRHPRAHQERHLRDDQPAHRPRHRVARRGRARLRGGRDRGGRRRRRRRATATARSPRRPRRSSSRRTTRRCSSRERRS